MKKYDGYNIRNNMQVVDDTKRRTVRTITSREVGKNEFQVYADSENKMDYVELKADD